MIINRFWKLHMITCSESNELHTLTPCKYTITLISSKFEHVIAYDRLMAAYSNSLKNSIFKYNYVKICYMSCLVLCGTLQNHLLPAVGWRPTANRAEDNYVGLHVIKVVHVIPHESYCRWRCCFECQNHVYAPRHTLLKESWSDSRNLHNHGLSNITRKCVAQGKHNGPLWQSVRYISNQIPTYS